MATVRMSESELQRDLHAALDKVRQGTEIVVEQDRKPVAVIKAAKQEGRLISEILADLKTRNSSSTMDDDFAHDIEEGILAHRTPWNPPTLE